MTYVLPPMEIPSLPVVGTEARFALRRVFCVGRNYAAHAREMGKDPDREPPFFFMKPADAVVGGGVTIPYPPETSNLQHEAELVVAIGKGGMNITQDDALGHVWGYAIGNDLTRRDLQGVAKELGRPWDWGKGFDNSAVVGPVHPVSAVGHLTAGAITCTVNDALRQEGDLSDMIWDVPEVISILSRSMALRPGDLIMTGTPAGVGKLVPGDTCTVDIAGLGTLTTTIGAPL
ncbi:fumarylacetoacetate hydrolase family protein [Mesobacterium sp. TK19101]|uniref:Fumarylacetoacetate hydrolase family protein n=1 Tax=Mesobacterium hydrothermale TaxID=3111907 RepID=A0ABU6HDI0_9RHOB|nr:fumarylacetoacetate hydrolase family protein [Mesobacterium sp. TK19101]MEC3860522.1 fumarylacetoacetate hydrolase family protein [Mesobacterium sp. TK19101]